MPLYEHTFLARQDVTQAQVEALMKEFEGVITAGNGKVTKQEYWGLKGLAFKVKKNRKAHYAFFNIDSPPAAVAEMERLMGINPDVIRFLTVRVEELETEPSVQMRKSDRDDRGDRGDRGGFGGPRGGGGGGGGGMPAQVVGEGKGVVKFFNAGKGFGFIQREGDAPRAPFGDRGPRPPRDGDAPRAPRPPRDAGPTSSGSEG